MHDEVHKDWMAAGVKHLVLVGVWLNDKLPSSFCTAGYVMLLRCAQQDKTNLKVQLEQLSRQAQWLVLWLDCDREGENIGFEVRGSVRVMLPSKRMSWCWGLIATGRGRLLGSR